MVGTRTQLRRPGDGMELRFRIVPNVMIKIRVRVRVRLLILILILTLILTVDELPLVTFSPKLQQCFPKSYRVYEILNFPVPISTWLPGLSGYVLALTVRYGYNRLQLSTSKVGPRYSLRK